MFDAIVMLHQEDACACEIIDVKEFSSRRAGAPHDYIRLTFLTRVMEPANECRQHMRAREVEIVMRAVQVGWHR
jgi:hypothetical protein